MKISIFWTGYVGLVTGTCLAEVWHEVLCVDIDEKKILEKMRGNIIIDGRNIWNKSDFTESELIYESIWIA